MHSYQSNRLQKLWKLPVVRLFIFSSVFYIIAFQYCRGHSYRDPGSAFFDQARAYVRWYTEYRYEEAAHFTASAALSASLDAGRAHKKDRWVKAGKDPQMCATIITVKRDVRQQYIDFSIGSMLDGLTAAERADMSLNVFFPQLDPSTHPAWNETWLNDLVDHTFSYGDALSVADMDKAINLTTTRNFVEKAILDYVTALQHCYDSTKSPFIAIFEDDVVFADSWLARSLEALHEVEGRSKKWLYMRLFNQERSTGWQVNKFAIAFVSSLAVYPVLSTLRRKSFMVRRRLDNASANLVAFVIVPAFVLLFFMAGKATLFPPAPGVRQESFGCCSQGLIYPRSQIPALIQYLRAVVVHKTDLLINSFSRVYHLARYSLYPVMMQHIGTTTSQPTKDISAAEPRAVWSMAFENLNPEILAKEHSRLVEQIYGPQALNLPMYYA